MIVAMAGTKGAPGATTACFGIACFLRRKRTVVMVEADAEGGCLAARLGLAQEPGLSTLAAAGRHELSEGVLAGHLQGGPGGLGLLVAPSAPSQARASLRAASSLCRILTELKQADVVIDVGRLDAESPALPFVRVAERVLLFAGPTLEGADAAAVRLSELVEVRPLTHLVTVGDGPYAGDEVAQVLAIDHAGHLPHDPAGASMLWTSTERSLDSRRPLLRSLAQLADQLVSPVGISSDEAGPIPGGDHDTRKRGHLAREMAR